MCTESVGQTAVLLRDTRERNVSVCLSSLLGSLADSSIVLAHPPSAPLRAHPGAYSTQPCTLQGPRGGAQFIPIGVVGSQG